MKDKLKTANCGFPQQINKSRRCKNNTASQSVKQSVSQSSSPSFSQAVSQSNNQSVSQAVSRLSQLTETVAEHNFPTTEVAITFQISLSSASEHLSGFIQKHSPGLHTNGSYETACSSPINCCRCRSKNVNKTQSN